MGKIKQFIAKTALKLICGYEIIKYYECETVFVLPHLKADKEETRCDISRYEEEKIIGLEIFTKDSTLRGYLFDDINSVVEIEDDVPIIISNATVLQIKKHKKYEWILDDI